MHASALASIAVSTGNTIAIAMMFATVTGAVIAAVVLSARQQRTCMAAWRSYAASRGARVMEKEGPWYRQQGPMIRGQRDGVDFTIDLHYVSNGKTSTTYTRIHAACARAGLVKLSLHHNGFWVRLGRSMGMKFVETGDAHFDARFALRSKTGGAFDEIFDPPTRERLLQLDPHSSLCIKDGVATLQWVGWEKNEAVLDLAVAAMAALCRPQHAALAEARR